MKNTTQFNKEKYDSFDVNQSINQSINQSKLHLSQSPKLLHNYATGKEEGRSSGSEPPPPPPGRVACERRRLRSQDTEREILLGMFGGSMWLGCPSPYPFSDQNISSQTH